MLISNLKENPKKYTLTVLDGNDRSTPEAKGEKHCHTGEPHTFATVPQSLGSSYPSLRSCEHKRKVLTSQGHDSLALISRAPVVSFTEGLNFVSNHGVDTHDTYTQAGTQLQGSGSARRP